jgi:hypothetical protein
LSIRTSEFEPKAVLNGSEAGSYGCVLSQLTAPAKR